MRYSSEQVCPTTHPLRVVFRLSLMCRFEYDAISSHKKFYAVCKFTTQASEGLRWLAHWKFWFWHRENGLLWCQWNINRWYHTLLFAGQDLSGILPKNQTVYTFGIDEKSKIKNQSQNHPSVAYNGDKSGEFQKCFATYTKQSWWYISYPEAVYVYRIRVYYDTIYNSGRCKYK